MFNLKLLRSLLVVLLMGGISGVLAKKHDDLFSKEKSCSVASKLFVNSSHKWRETYILENERPHGKGWVLEKKKSKSFSLDKQSGVLIAAQFSKSKNQSAWETYKMNTPLLSSGGLLQIPSLAALGISKKNLASTIKDEDIINNLNLENKWYRISQHFLESKKKDVIFKVTNNTDFPLCVAVCEDFSMWSNDRLKFYDMTTPNRYLNNENEFNRLTGPAVLNGKEYTYTQYLSEFKRKKINYSISQDDFMLKKGEYLFSRYPMKCLEPAVVEKKGSEALL